MTTAKLNNGAVTAAKLAAGSAEQRRTAEGRPDAARGVQPRRHQGLRQPKASAFGAISFQQTLAANPTATVVVPKGGPFTTQCPGLGGGGTTPEATAGVVCIYLTHGNRTWKASARPR